MTEKSRKFVILADNTIVYVNDDDKGAEELKGKKDEF
jgi:hypothetical protein